MINQSSLKFSVWSSKAAEFYHVLFRVHRDAEPCVEVQSAFHLRRSPPRWRSSLQSEITLELYDKNGALLEIVPSYAIAEGHDIGPSSDYVAGFPAHPGFESVRFIRDGNVLANMKVAGVPPRVAISDISRTESKHGNLMRVTWKGHAGKDVVPALEYGVRFSHDGEHWRALAAGTSETKLVVNVDLLPGGKNCRLQIVASAGFRTKIIEADEFSVPKKPRRVYILSPSAEVNYQAGTPIALVGGGFSPDYGLTTPDQIVWSSSSIGILGTGHQIVTTALGAGEHNINCEVPDGVGGRIASSVLIKVKPSQEPPTGARKLVGHALPTVGCKCKY